MALPENGSIDWINLPNKSHEELRSLGFNVWNKTAEGALYLFPFSWYNLIPDGYKLKCIDGTTEYFEHGVTDDDHRGGCIAYGFVKPNDVPITK